MTTISSEPFGTLDDGSRVERYTLSNEDGSEAAVLTYGGIVQSLLVPGADGERTDVVLGFDSLEGYVADGCYIGPIVGRYANRIAHGRFTIDGIEYQLPLNDGPNQLHGGPVGFNRHVWRARVDGHTLVLSLTSPAGDQGCPGTLDVVVTYEITPLNELVISYGATTDAATHVNLTYHGYFNLRGHGAGDILEHELTLAASSYLPVDNTLIPAGERRAVANSAFDFTHGRVMGGGYDHNFILDRIEQDCPNARVVDPRSGRWMEIRTTEPGVQLYAGQGLSGIGKGGVRYTAHAGLALETQHFPDSPNQPSFPSTLLRPGERFSSRTAYRFG